jgi:GNAT superfamily N-acetyltransferase
VAQVEPVLIRLAAREDLRTILTLLADDDLASHPERDGHGEDLAPYLEAFDEIAADPRSDVYVAAIDSQGESAGVLPARRPIDGRVVGTFQLTAIRHLTYRGGRVAVVESVHVASDVRRRGIGEAMMRFAIEEARRRGCHRVQLTSNKRRTEAHRFYERLGFVASHEGFRLALSR